MIIYVLGSGAGVLTGSRYHTSLMVSDGESSLLIDAGPPIFKRLYELGLNLNLPKYIFISHYHHDHVGGIFMYLYEIESRNFKTLPTLIANKYTAARVKNALETFVKSELHPEMITFDDALDKKIYLDSYELSLIPVRHSVPTHGVWIRSYKDEKTLFYSSDTLFMPELTDKIVDCDIGFHEATLSIDMESKAIEHGYHSSPRQAIESLKRCNQKVLIHISTVTFKDPFQSEHKFLVAQDGMIIKI